MQHDGYQCTCSCLQSCEDVAVAVQSYTLQVVSMCRVDQCLAFSKRPVQTTAPSFARPCLPSLLAPSSRSPLHARPSATTK